MLQATVTDPRLAGVAPEILADLEVDRARLAKEQAAAGAAKLSGQRRDFGRALRQGHSDVTAGIAGPAYSRADFVRLYGEAEADKRLAAWQAAQAKAPAYALVRGKSPAEIEQAKAGYGGDRLILGAIEAEDAAERAKDPAGYALRWLPGVRDSLARAAHEGKTNAELAQLRADELWEAQAALGIAEARRSPWTLEESQAIARQWLAAEAQPAGVARGEALVTLLREQVLSLPAEQRAGAIAALERQGLDERAPGRIRATVAALEQGAMATAYRAANDSTTASGLLGVPGASSRQGPPRPGQAADGGDSRPVHDGPGHDDSLKLPRASSNGRYVELEDPALGVWEAPSKVQGNWISDDYVYRAERAVGMPIPKWKRDDKEDGLLLNWYPWHAAVKNAGVGQNQYFSLMEIFAAEGGLEQAPGGSAVFGILQKTVKTYGAEAGVPADALPGDLTNAERIRIFQAYMGWKEGALKTVGGVDALEAMGDKRVAAAVADTLWTRGAPAIRGVLQPAINEVLATESDLTKELFERRAQEGRLSPSEAGLAETPALYRLVEDGLFGPKALMAIQAIVQSPEATAHLLRAIAQARFDFDKGKGKVLAGDVRRYKHFAFPKEGDVIIFSGE